MARDVSHLESWASHTKLSGRLRQVVRRHSARESESARIWQKRSHRFGLVVARD